MGKQCLYVLHPRSSFLPGIVDWVSEIELVAHSDDGWADWEIVWLEMNEQNNFKVTEVVVQVLQRPGPIVVFDCASGRALRLLQGRMLQRVVVQPLAPIDTTDLWEAINQTRQLHEQGQPMLPRKLVCAILILRKLYRWKYWGGTRDKNFIWGDELAKGRGVDEKFADIAREVANDLLQNHILLPKYGGARGKKSQKYALNPAKKAAIEKIVFLGQFEDQRLLDVLMRDRRLEPRTSLDWGSDDELDYLIAQRAGCHW